MNAGVYRGLHWTLRGGRLTVVCGSRHPCKSTAIVLIKTLPAKHASDVRYAMLRWGLTAAGHAKCYDLRPYDGVPWEINTLRDEDAYQAAKTAYLAAQTHDAD